MRREERRLGPILDVCCGDCQRAGDPNPPRLARFVRLPDGKVELDTRAPMHAQMRGRRFSIYFPPHRRPDGGVTWQLRCSQGHNRPIRHERLVAAFEHLPAGQDYARLYF